MLLDDGEVLVFNVHVQAHLCTRCCHQQAVEYRLHVGIGRLEVLLIHVQEMLVVAAYVALVEDAQHLVQPVVYLPVQAWYLDDDAVVVQAVNELVGNSLRDGLLVVVESLVAHIHNWFVDVAHGVPQQVDGHHGQGMAVGAVGHYVLWVLVVYAQVLSETQRLCWQPRLLQLYQYELLLAVGAFYGGTEVDAEDGERLFLSVGVLVGAHLYPKDFFLQQCREDCAGNALVLHEVLEHCVIDGVGNCYHNTSKALGLQK